ncbi:hypothetical protein FYJ46_24185 [Enterobacteriaceae bacterium]|nr:hypothetical protein [Enterobacteriaceae bacterium]
MTSLKTSIKTITYLSDIGCLEIQGASLPVIQTVTGRRPREFSLFMKIFREPCPVSLQVNYMKNKKRGLL